MVRRWCAQVNRWLGGGVGGVLLTSQAEEASDKTRIYGKFICKHISVGVTDFTSGRRSLECNFWSHSLAKRVCNSRLLGGERLLANQANHTGFAWTYSGLDVFRPEQQDYLIALRAILEAQSSPGSVRYSPKLYRECALLLPPPPGQTAASC